MTGPADGEIRDRLVQGRVHFAGIGGAGMCALAEAVVRARPGGSGAGVTGCDTAPGATVEGLRNLGVEVFEGHDPGHVDGVELVVTTAAVPSDHPELARARARDILVVKRARALGAWVNAGTVVGVAGTHGKTTTTAMTTAVLARGGMDPTGFVGGRVHGWEGNLRPGGDALFVVEADEYDRSFHHLRPTVAVITNMEADHLDVYGDLDGVREAFLRYLGGVAPGGTVLVCADDPGASSLPAALRPPLPGVVSYGFSAGSRLRGGELEAAPTRTRFRVWEEGVDRGFLEVPIPGGHNARNALAAAGVGRALGVGWEPIREALAGFRGVERRFQHLGEHGGVTVVDDYAHHPTELAAAIEAGRQFFPAHRLVAVFQPHLYTRTRDFADAFAEVLARADLAWITGIYPAREPPIPGIDAAYLAGKVESLRGAGATVREVRVTDALDALPGALAAGLRAGDLCLLLGAGSIERTGPALVQLLERGATGGEHADA